MSGSIDIKVDLNELAEKLGLTVFQMVEIYAQRAWTTWVDVFVALLSLLICVGLAVVSVRRAMNLYKRYKLDWDEVAFIILFYGAFVIFIGIYPVCSLCHSLNQAIRASASPEAYALDEISKWISKK